MAQLFGIMKQFVQCNGTLDGIGGIICSVKETEHKLIHANVIARHIAIVKNCGQ